MKSHKKEKKPRETWLILKNPQEFQSIAWNFATRSLKNLKEFLRNENEFVKWGKCPVET